MSPAAGRRVALLTPCYWPEVRRGGERFVHELGTELLALGHRPRIVTSHRASPTRSVEDGMPIERSWRPPDGRLRRRHFEDHLTHLPFTYASLVRGDDDVAHAIYPTDALAAARWSRRTGRPSVLSYLGIPDRTGLVYKRRRLAITLKAIAECTAVTALSRTAADAFRYWLGVEARVVYPGVDLRAFTPGAGRAEHPTIFCSASADEPRKRVELLVRAFALVRRERRDARLVLSRPRDRGLAQQLVDGGAELVDVDDREALALSNRQAWVAALPSYGEAFGLVLVEALACGTPVVASDEGALPEVVDRAEIGRLFSGDGPEPLARALLDAFELAEDPGTAAACRARAEDFSTHRTALAYAELYRSLIER